MKALHIGYYHADTEQIKNGDGTQDQLLKDDRLSISKWVSIPLKQVPLTHTHLSELSKPPEIPWLIF